MDELGRKDRVILALLRASEVLRCRDLRILTWEQEGVERVKGRRVRITPVWRWLLDEDTDFSWTVQTTRRPRSVAK